MDTEYKLPDNFEKIVDDIKKKDDQYDERRRALSTKEKEWKHKHQYCKPLVKKRKISKKNTKWVIPSKVMR